MNRIINMLKKVDTVVGIFLRWLVVGCASVLFLLLIMNVAARFMHINSFPWLDEVVEWVFSWMVFFGAAALWRSNDHFCIDLVTSKIECRKSGKAYRLVLEIISLLFFSVMAVYGVRHTINATQWTSILHISKRYLYVCVPLSGFLLVAYSVRNVVREVVKLVEKEI